MHTLKFQGLGGIDFHNNRIRALYIRSSVAQGRGRNDVAFFSNSTSLYYCHIHLAKITATAELG